MAVLDDISAEKQRITDRLARVDGDRERLMQQLADLEAAERVLSRMAPSAPHRGRRGRVTEEAEGAPAGRARRGRRARQAETTAGAPAPRQGTGRGGRRARQKAEVSLGEATLQAIEALGNNVIAEQIREYLERDFGMQVRPNHLGMALQRHPWRFRLPRDSGINGSCSVRSHTSH